MTDFVFNTALVVYRMFAKGYDEKRVWLKVRSFLTTNPSMYGSKPVLVWMGKLQRKIEQLRAGAILPGPFGQIQA